MAGGQNINGCTALMIISQKIFCCETEPTNFRAPLIIALNEENHGEPSDCRNEKWPILEVLATFERLTSAMCYT